LHDTFSVPTNITATEERAGDTGILGPKDTHMEIMGSGNDGLFREPNFSRKKRKKKRKKKVKLVHTMER
jgi:hypothetical protein